MDEAAGLDRILTAPNVITLVRLLCIPLFLWLLFGLHRQTPAGPVTAGLAAELDTMEALFAGASAAVSHDLGMAAPVATPTQGAERARRQVGGYGGKLGIGSRTEGLPDPLLAFVLGQPAFGKGRLENVDCAFPVRCRGSHVAVSATKPSMTWFRQHRFLQHRVPAIPGSRLRRAGQSVRQALEITDRNGQR